MKLVKMAAIVVGGAVALTGLVAASVYAISEVMIHASVTPARGSVTASQGPDSVSRGRKVATVNGCLTCHGPDLQGMLFHDEPMLLRGYAPNITFAAARYTDEQLDAAVRKGVTPSGRALWIMPSAAFAYMSDEEAADLIAYIRSVPLGGQEQPRTTFGPILRAAMVLGKLRSEPGRIKANHGREPEDAGAATAPGRRLSRACIECHGPTLDGDDILGAPDLMVAGAYDDTAFETLMRSATAADGRKIEMMAGGRFAAFSAEDRHALLSYLRARAAQRAKAAEAPRAPAR